MKVNVVGLDSVDRIYLVESRDQWWALVSAVMDSLVP
jgi:hypothetical protein